MASFGNFAANSDDEDYIGSNDAESEDRNIAGEKRVVIKQDTGLKARAPSDNDSSSVMIKVGDSAGNSSKSGPMELGSIGQSEFSTSNEASGQGSKPNNQAIAKDSDVNLYLTAGEANAKYNALSVQHKNNEKLIDFGGNENEVQMNVEIWKNTSFDRNQSRSTNLSGLDIPLD